MNLQETFSLCVIMYAMHALCLTNRQNSKLNACWNDVIRLFGFNKLESVSAMLLGLDMPVYPTNESGVGGCMNQFTI